MRKLHIQHNKPFVDRSDIAAIESVLRSGWLAKGEQAKEFERRLAKLVGKEYAVATNSGTAALHLVLLALEVGRGDEVILPTYVCSAVLNAVNYVNASPVIVDVGHDFNISPQEVADAITANTKAIIAIHTYGIPCEVETLLNMGPLVIEDCAQALGTTRQDKMVGSKGIATIFSFYATKVITTGYGGMALTSDAKLYNIMSDLCHYNMPPKYKIRYNYEMGDIQASLGLSQLDKLSSLIEKRRRIAGKYTESIKNGRGELAVRIPQSLLRQGNNFYRYTILSKSAKELSIAFKMKGIEVINPLQTFELLHNYLKLSSRNFPVAESLVGQTVSLPIYPALYDDTKDVDYVCDVLTKTVRLEEE